MINTSFIISLLLVANTGCTQLSTEAESRLHIIYGSLHEIVIADVHAGRWSVSEPPHGEQIDAAIRSVGLDPSDYLFRKHEIGDFANSFEMNTNGLIVVERPNSNARRVTLLYSDGAIISMPVGELRR